MLLELEENRTQTIRPQKVRATMWEYGMSERERYSEREGDLVEVIEVIFIALEKLFPSKLCQQLS